jgi:hypothetical protein
MKVVVRPNILLNEEELKAVKLVRDMLVEVECVEGVVPALEENYAEYIDGRTSKQSFITCVDFLSSLLWAMGEDENEDYE